MYHLLEREITALAFIEVLILLTLNPECNLCVEKVIGVDVVHLELREILAQVVSHLEFVTLADLLDEWQHLRTVHDVEDVHPVDEQLHDWNVFASMAADVEWVDEFSVNAHQKSTRKFG